MKKLLLFCLPIILAGTINAQTVTNKEFNLSNIQKVKTDFEYADVVFKPSKNNSLSVKATVSIAGGESNDSYVLENSTSNGTLYLKSYVKNVDDLPRTVKVKKDGQTYIFQKSGKETYKQVRKRIKEELGVSNLDMYTEGYDIDITLEISIPARVDLEVNSNFGDLKFDKCGNKLKVECTYGSVEAIVVDASTEAEMDLLSTYSFVDVALPTNYSADVELKTNYGKIMSDFNLDIDNDKSRSGHFKEYIVGTINNGGNSIKLKATYKNIYFRKNKSI